MVKLIVTLCRVNNTVQHYALPFHSLHCVEKFLPIEALSLLSSCALTCKWFVVRLHFLAILSISSFSKGLNVEISELCAYFEQTTS